MCGIIGLHKPADCKVSSRIVKQCLKSLFIDASSRGRDSSGVAWQIDGQCFLFRHATPSNKLFHQKALLFLLRDIDSACKFGKSLSIIGHARLVTNGHESDNANNQPVLSGNSCVVHNGIICNIDQLWNEEQECRQHEVDTEWIAHCISKINSTSGIEDGLQSMHLQMEGANSYVALAPHLGRMLLHSNHENLHYTTVDGINWFASEAGMLLRAISKSYKLKLSVHTHVVKSLLAWSFPNLNQQVWKDFSAYKSPSMSILSTTLTPYLQYNESALLALKRCTRCILPETFPGIFFDNNGICSVCHAWRPPQQNGRGDMQKIISEWKRNLRGENDCLLTLSGGRDSCYGLHLAVKELGLKPIAYTYDWGMVTDLARRNQSRLCGALGVPHILISADITRKRKNIAKNVSAWLKSPHLGMVPLFMAGDKAFFHWANKIKQQEKLPGIILCENMLETTGFKTGFAGVGLAGTGEHTYALNSSRKIALANFYLKQFLGNSSYLNSSLLDTLSAFAIYYFEPRINLNLFDYLPWNEAEVDKVLIDRYGWETSPDSPSTWRIGDGTAAFYNYIYCTISGLTEFDTLRSNQIRAGMLSRSEGLSLVIAENRPREASIRWYLETLGIDGPTSINTINKIPRMFAQ